MKKRESVSSPPASPAHGSLCPPLPINYPLPHLPNFFLLDSLSLLFFVHLYKFFTSSWLLRLQQYPCLSCPLAWLVALVWPQALASLKRTLGPPSNSPPSPVHSHRTPVPEVAHPKDRPTSAQRSRNLTTQTKIVCHPNPLLSQYPLP